MDEQQKNSGTLAFILFAVAPFVLWSASFTLGWCVI